MRCFISSEPQSFTDRVLIAWSRSAAGAADRAWHALANLPQRWTAPEFPLKAAGFHRSRHGRRPGSGRGYARGRDSLDRRGFSG